ncbi:LamG-like jellyroll fold domain-containing protein, partial [Salmonella sp. SAL4435]|uniref:LamG-like jellyroll fold domain-containing protein n=1 Tax=Salmonella sp. SAL4435 TaxID=3159890 RepID=UPI00397B3612
TATSGSSYVALPAGLFTATTDMSVSVWVNLQAARNWQRIFDFGASNTAYMVLTTTANSTPNMGLRFAISNNGISSE